jgi:hypothetical protein
MFIAGAVCGLVLCIACFIALFRSIAEFLEFGLNIHSLWWLWTIMGGILVPGVFLGIRQIVLARTPELQGSFSSLLLVILGSILAVLFAYIRFFPRKRYI